MLLEMFIVMAILFKLISVSFSYTTQVNIIDFIFERIRAYVNFTDTHKRRTMKQRNNL